MCPKVYLLRPKVKPRPTSKSLAGGSLTYGPDGTVQFYLPGRKNSFLCPWTGLACLTCYHQPMYYVVRSLRQLYALDA